MPQATVCVAYYGYTAASSTASIVSCVLELDLVEHLTRGEWLWVCVNGDGGSGGWMWWQNKSKIRPISTTITNRSICSNLSITDPFTNHHHQTLNTPFNHDKQFLPYLDKNLHFKSTLIFHFYLTKQMRFPCVHTVQTHKSVSAKHPQWTWVYCVVLRIIGLFKI